MNTNLCPPVLLSEYHNPNPETNRNISTPIEPNAQIVFIDADMTTPLSYECTTKINIVATPISSDLYLLILVTLKKNILESQVW